MNVICSHVERVEMPLPIDAHLANGTIDTLTLFNVKNDGIGLKFALIEIAPSIASWKVRRVVSIVEAVN